MLADPFVDQYENGSLLVLALPREGKLVLWLSVRDFVDTEPLICGPQKAGQMSLNILNVVKSRCQWVVDVNDDDLPVRLFFVKKSHDS